jgi:hypothetical protein
VPSPANVCVIVPTVRRDYFVGLTRLLAFRKTRFGWTGFSIPNDSLTTDTGNIKINALLRKHCNREVLTPSSTIPEQVSTVPNLLQHRHDPQVACLALQGIAINDNYRPKRAHRRARSPKGQEARCCAPASRGGSCATTIPQSPGGDSKPTVALSTEPFEPGIGGIDPRILRSCRSRGCDGCHPRESAIGRVLRN